MAAAIKQEFDLEAELIKGSGGVFDVKIDGKLIYSKQETGRFPSDDEICAKLRSS